MVQARGRWSAGIVAVMLSTAALAGCGGDGDVKGSSSNPDAVRLDGVGGNRGIILASAVDSVDDGTARMSAKADMGSFLSVAIDGDVDFDSGNSALTVDFGAMGGLAGLVGDRSDPDSLKLEVRNVDGTVYVRVPAALAGQYPGTQAGEAAWISVDAESLAQTPDESLGQLREQADPRVYLSYLQRASDDIEETGREEIRGTDTTRYEGTIDLTQDLEDLPDDARRQLEEQYGTSSAAMLEDLGDELEIESLPFTAWIDDEGRLRKMEVELDLADALENSAAEEGDDAESMAGLLAAMLGDGLTISVELYDYGADVDVKAPPADEVTDLTPSDLGMPEDGDGGTDGSSAESSDTDAAA